MALNLSTLTSPATSGDVLAEALTTADFLEPVPVLRNLARGSQKGGDAKQGTALNQPKALPLIDGKGYLYLSGVSGNGAVIGQSVLPATGDFDLRINFIYTLNTNSETDIFSQYEVDQTGRFFIAFDNNNKRVKIFWNGFGNIFSPNDSLSVGQRYVLKLTRSGSAVSLHLNDVLQVSHTIGNSIPIHQVNSTVGFAYSRTSFHSLGAVFSVTEGSNVNVDFTATNVRHGDTKFKCATGQVVTINKSGNDPATVIKKPVLRFDGTNDTLGGLFNQTLDGGYMFAAFSVLGDGGIAYGRIFSTNKTTLADTDSSGFIWALRNNLANDLHYWSQDYRGPHADFFDADRGDYIYELKNTNGSQKSKVNDADLKTSSISTSLELQEFNIGAQHQGGARYTSIDLEYLALFPATITDDQADSVRNYINNRNNVFSLVDGFGYYFYDAQKAPVGAISSGSSAWNGRIIGSDNGDISFNSTQGTQSAQPVSDGYVVTFADNTDHIEIPQVTLASGDSYAWMVCGTSLGTFAYKVTVSGRTELTLLGHLGNASFRKAGDLYGVILLPESATGKDIESARSLLIDRGAADGTTGNNFNTFWYDRTDIVEFSFLNTSSVTSFAYSWVNCSSLQSFPLIDTSNATSMLQAWQNNTSLQSFPAIQAPLCTNFTSAWQGTTALTSFPAGAKLGTSASNVNFTSAWRDSGLTSFPADIDLSKGGQFLDAWHDTNLISFSTPITGVNAKRMRRAWKDCDQLTDFSYNVFANWNPSVIQSQCFNSTWDGCTALTADSVGNILRGIDASNQFATVDGNSGSAAIADAAIDIDYNTATGSLSAATNTAVTSLKSKGWSIIVNNVTL